MNQHVAPAPHQPRWRTIPFRAEGWEDGDMAHCLVLSANILRTQAWMLSLNRRTGQVDARIGMFHTADHPDIARAPREALVPGLHETPVTRHLLTLFGLPLGTEPGLASALLHSIVFEEGAGSAMVDISRHIRAVTERAQRVHTTSYAELARNRHLVSRRNASKKALMNVDASSGWGYRSRKDKDHEPHFRFVSVHPVDGGTPAAMTHVDPDVSHAHPELYFTALRDEVADAIRAAMGPIRAHYADLALDGIIAKREWTPELHAFYAAPGRTGERRRQAGRLYPVFAPLIAHDSEIREMVEAGRPFEGRLRNVVASWMPEDLGDKVTVGLLRRFRTLGGQPDFDALKGYVHIATRLPVDWLPATKDQWDAFCDALPKIDVYSHDYGLELRDLVDGYGGRWKALVEYLEVGHVTEEYDYSGIDLLRGAQDPLNRFVDTLAVPCVWTLPTLCGHEGPERPRVRRDDLKRIAGSLLFGRKALAGVIGLGVDWHDGYARFETALPRHESSSTWPALIEPWTAPNGIVAVPLTTVGQLIDEGASGLDSGGVAGLSHCVGGYGRQCFTGESHIVSLRRPLPEGGFERLSTIEFSYGTVHTSPDGAEKDVAVVQHYGHGNGQPPAEATEAATALLAGMHRGLVPLNPAALERRDDRDFDQACDWSDPANLEKSFAAWAPFLPGDIAKAGVQSLRERIGAVLSTWSLIQDGDMLQLVPASPENAKHDLRSAEGDRTPIMDEGHLFRHG